MKNLAFVTLVSTLGFLTPAYSQVVEVVKVTPELIFSPIHFDDNDLVQIVIDGYFPNGCYKVGPTDVKVNQEQKVILLTNLAHVSGAPFCPEVLVDYTKSVELGVLKAGQYKIYVDTKTSGLQLRGSLNVSKATSANIDDYLYAPVSEATMDFANPRRLFLRGTFKSTCMQLEEVKVLTGKSNVIEVLPIAVMKGINCRPVNRPFEYRIDFPTSLRGRTLIHTRSLNGQSVNKIMNL